MNEKVKAYRVQSYDWMALAYARSRGDAIFQTIHHYGVDEECFFAMRAYRVPVLDDKATERGIEERYEVWFEAGFNPYGDEKNRP